MAHFKTHATPQHLLMALCVLALGTGCAAVERMATSAVADSVAMSSAVYATDGDVELVGQAIPFGLKTIESLLEKMPGHRRRLGAFLHQGAGRTHRRPARAQTLHLDDLESRYVCFNLYWDYLSVGCFNEMLEHTLRNVRNPINFETRVLVAANDGYWQGRREDDVMTVIDRYLSKKTVTFKNASHLWVIAPENVTEMLA